MHLSVIFFLISSALGNVQGHDNIESYDQVTIYYYTSILSEGWYASEKSMFTEDYVRVNAPIKIVIKEVNEIIEISGMMRTDNIKEIQTQSIFRCQMVVDFSSCGRTKKSVSFNDRGEVRLNDDDSADYAATDNMLKFYDLYMSFIMNINYQESK